MHLIFGQDDFIKGWVAKRTNVSSFGPAATIGIADGNRLIAGVVYSNFREGNIEASIAADHPGWCRRGVLRALMSYPFDQLQCRRITCLIPSTHVKSLRLCRGLGFKIEGLCREGFGPGVDAIVMGLLRRECRWLKVEYPGNQQIRTLAAGSS